MTECQVCGNLPPGEASGAADVCICTPNEQHDHRYVFLRQETRPTKQWDWRVLERIVEDVYFCEGCLSYQRVYIRREVPDPRSFGWVEA